MPQPVDTARRWGFCTSGTGRDLDQVHRIGFPVAYTIAFRGGRFKNLLLFLVIAPFFTSFLIRTISWKTLLDGPFLGFLRDVAPGEEPRGSGRTGGARQCAGRISATRVIELDFQVAGILPPGV